MKILFFGDCMFGRDNNPFIENPFVNIENAIKNVDLIIFNLETNISVIPLEESLRDDKVFNYQSNGIQLITLRKLTDKPIIASIANNHSLDYGLEGYKATKEFLGTNNILFADKREYLELDNIIYISASDHCGCKDIKIWGQYIWIIDYSNLKPIIDKLAILKKKKKKIVFSLHWGSNWVDEIPPEMSSLGKLLIDNGVSIVFGHSAHHIPPIPVEKYKGGFIIYGLGDFINDYAVTAKYKSDHSLMCGVDLKKKLYSLYPVKRSFINKNSIPFLL